MTTKEKSRHPQDIYTMDTRGRSARILDDYINTLKATSEEHTADARRRADMRMEAEAKKLGRGIDKRPSISQSDLKREASHKQEELKDKLFVELRDKPTSFMETQDCQRLLDRQVKATEEFAGDEELVIYMNPPDADKLQRITMHYNTTIKVGEYSFSEDIGAVLPDEHILIDNPLQAKPDEVRHEFKSGLTEGR